MFNPNSNIEAALTRAKGANVSYCTMEVYNLAGISLVRVKNACELSKFAEKRG